MTSIVLSWCFMATYFWSLYWKVHSHIRLTFPPARTYALDFLNNMSSEAPCGFKSYSGNCT